MYGTKEERLAIGKRIYDGELTANEVAIEYQVSLRSAESWVQQYKESIGIETPKRKTYKRKVTNNVLSNERAAYEEMTRDELIDALILARANELRAKKGYEVKGDGANKEFIPLTNKNTK